MQLPRSFNTSWKSYNQPFESPVPSEEHAAAHISVLVEADRRGHYSHGFNRCWLHNQTNSKV